MVKDNGLPPPPRGLPADPRHATANALHSAALRLLRHARAADGAMDLDGPRASALSVLVFGGAMPIGRLAVAEQVSAPAITKTVAALEADGLAERLRSSRRSQGGSRPGDRGWPRATRTGTGGPGTADRQPAGGVE